MPALERHLTWLFTLGFVFSLAFGAWVLVNIWRAGRGEWRRAAAKRSMFRLSMLGATSVR